MTFSGGKHVTVLGEEVVHFLVRGRQYARGVDLLILDGTVGGGGHSELLLKSSPAVKIVALDQDEDALSRSAARLHQFSDRVLFRHGNFRTFETVKQQIRELAIERAFITPEAELRFDGIVLDLGFSSDQLDDPARGLSFNLDGPLDMRLDRASKLTASEIINDYSERELQRALRLGGVRAGVPLFVRAIMEERPITSTVQLASIVRGVAARIGRTRESRKSVRPRSDAATVVFQAIRIAVNDELGALNDFMEHAFTLLAQHGRLAIISFHSLEDKIVTHAMRQWEQAGKLSKFPAIYDQHLPGKLLTKKAVVPSEQEVQQNPRARSARLRVFERFSGTALNVAMGGG